MSRSAIPAIGLAAVLSACGAEPPAPPASPATEGAAVDAAPEGTAGASPEPALSTTAPSSTAAAKAPPAREELPLASESGPAGTQPLGKEEKAELETRCKGLLEAMERAAKKGSRNVSREEALALAEKFVADNPTIKGVDVPRCGGLLLRDLKVYRARTFEVEANVTLGTIVVGLASALEADPPRLCPSAGPVPSDLSAVQGRTYESKPAEWQAPGWRCASFAGPPGPQRFQYELKTDAAARTFEIVARGFPLPGGPMTELVTRGAVENGKIQPTRQVWRRR